MLVVETSSCSAGSFLYVAYIGDLIRPCLDEDSDNEFRARGNVLPPVCLHLVVKLFVDILVTALLSFAAKRAFELCVIQRVCISVGCFDPSLLRSLIAPCLLLSIRS